jgi:hypothetical protein
MSKKDRQSSKNSRRMVLQGPLAQLSMMTSEKLSKTLTHSLHTTHVVPTYGGPGSNLEYRVVIAYPTVCAISKMRNNSVINVLPTAMSTGQT